MSFIRRKGSTGVNLLVHLRTVADGQGAVGLSALTPGARATALRAGERQARAFPLVHARLGEHLPGGFAEADPALLPGVYQFGVPDALLEGGADHVVVLLAFPGTVAEPIAITLVAYDPQDASRLGMTALGPEGRIAALRGAFPRVAAHELDERRASEEPGAGA